MGNDVFFKTIREVGSITFNDANTKIEEGSGDLAIYSDANIYHNVAGADQLTVTTSAINCHSNKITNLNEGTASTDAITKNYVDLSNNHTFSGSSNTYDTTYTFDGSTVKRTTQRNKCV